MKVQSKVQSKPGTDCTIAPGAPVQSVPGFDCTAALEAAAFLIDHGGGDRLMRLIRGKYQSLGKVGGMVTLPHPTEKEIDLLRGLLGMDPAGKDRVTVSLIKFQQAFSNTRFAGVTLEALLSAYFGEPVISHREDRERRELGRSSYLEAILGQVAHEELKLWLREELATSRGGIGATVVNVVDPAILVRQLELTIKVLSRLSTLAGASGTITLANLASDVCGDPHGLDSGTQLEKLLIAWLAHEASLPTPRNAEEKAALFFQSGILQDPGSRTLLVYGLEGYTDTDQRIGSGASDNSSKFASKGWSSFYANKEALTLNLMNLRQVDRIFPICNVKLQALDGLHDCTQTSPVFCFENPAVFYECIHHLPECAAICSSGQINQTTYLVLDRLIQSGSRICYSGDFDPEGLLIAEKLKQRYGQALTLIGYSVELYQIALSQNRISEKRLAQLSRITCPELIPVAQAIRQHKRAGYQENIRSQLLSQCNQCRA